MSKACCFTIVDVALPTCVNVCFSLYWRNGSSRCGVDRVTSALNLAQVSVHMRGPIRSCIFEVTPWTTITKPREIASNPLDTFPTSRLDQKGSYRMRSREVSSLRRHSKISWSSSHLPCPRPSFINPSAMSQRRSKRPQCSQDNCGSRRFHVGDDGFTYCDQGHQQSEVFTLIYQPHSPDSKTDIAHSLVLSLLKTPENW